MVECVADVKPRDEQHEDMLPLLKRHEIQVLLKAGLKKADVARIAEVSPRAVRRVAKEEAVTHSDDRAERRARGIGRPSKAEPFRALIEKTLKEEPDLPSLELLRRAKLAGYDGAKSAMYALIAGLRPPKSKPIVRFEGLPGEFTQHDFGEVDVRFADGTKKRIHFFASRLKYSRWVQVSIVRDQQVESLVRSLAEHFDAMGGVPLVAVFDRPRTIVKRAAKNGQVAEWNSTFAEAMLEMGVGVEVCWPRSGNQKGAVENLVGWVKGSFFKVRRFLDEQDLREQLAAWQTEVNTKVASRATGVTPAARMADEKARMRPLRVKPTDLALRIPISVGPTAEVRFDGVSYAMPPEATNLPATLYLYRDRVKIVAGRFKAEHPRGKPGSGAVTTRELRAQTLAAVHGKRAKRYFQREQLLGLGATAAQYVAEIVYRHQKSWSREIEVLFTLLQKHGDDAMREAFERASQAQTFGADAIRDVLSARDIVSGNVFPLHRGAR